MLAPKRVKFRKQQKGKMIMIFRKMLSNLRLRRDKIIQVLFLYLHLLRLLYMAL